MYEKEETITMRIVDYDGLRSKNELFPLFDQAFKWPFNPTEFEQTIKADPRLRNSPIGYAAVENNHIVGFVGVMDIATRTIDGSEEKVGGIWGVVTHPAYARRGISKALLQRSHGYFKEKDYQFAFLNTGKSLVAYALYKKLDYKDVRVYPSAYKLIKEPEKQAKMISRKVKLNWNKILRIYNQATKNRTGFIGRTKQYLETLEKRQRIHPEKSIVTDEGYVLLREDEKSLIVLEIIASTKEKISELITQIEKKAARAETVIDRAVLDENIQEAYRSQGYMVLKDSYNLLMAKRFTKTTLAETYGNRFYATSVDLF